MACSRMIVNFYLTGKYWESQNCNPPLLMDFSGPEFRTVKSKGIPRQAEVALGVPGRLRPRISSTFGTTRVVGRQPNAPAAFIIFRG